MAVCYRYASIYMWEREQDEMSPGCRLFAVIGLPCKIHVVEKAGSSSISSTSYMRMGMSNHK